MYKVIRQFSDLEDGRYVYRVGDVFPRAGLSVTNDRIAFLLSNKTKHGRPVIEEVTDKTAKKIAVKPVVVEPAAPIDKAVESVEETPTQEDKPKRGRPRKTEE